VNTNLLLGILQKDALHVNHNASLKSFEGTSVIVTGSSGLVGINIISSLIFYNKNFAKKTISIYAVSYSDPDKFIKKMFLDNNVKILYGDITNYDFLKKIPFADCIMHCAGYGQPGKFMADKIKTISINTTATIELIKKVRKGGRFLFMSSSEVYSGNLSYKDKEEDIGTTGPSHPRACYIEGKRTGEAIVNASRDSGINAVSVRLALAYGPGVKSDDARVLNQLVSKGLKGSIDLLDSGSAIRTYGYIADIIIMLFNILLKNNYSVFNVGGESTLSIKELAEKIGTKTNSKVSIPERSHLSIEGAPSEVKLDLSRIKSEYGHAKYLNMEEGLERTIEWIQNYQEV
jgi:UDP-glucuronate decarboxylase